ncbi:unnamed protein product (macronuclear) [Paramecium tetraurelia]|uniref:Uncharacterized protein n=1 Tax=Paramecium tetraurelia TaxID=5888 RepID=A0EDX5_PARTE|nr:uncharacterized protein GSPATT00025836001 [Paramecium tetraurelia]CAK93492.1 unnamed protein product [Paramecium tetraurelia]|eukprot:XP_001460889.1 hypothetical protein (macronuclear) [Paramecium tetraurelia strain d4-2]
MKTFIGFTLLYLILANQGIQSIQPDKLHPISKIILGLSEVQAKDFNFQQLFVALDELAESFQTRINEENSSYELDQQSYFSDVQFYENQINDFKNKIAQLEIEIKELGDEGLRLQAFLTEANQDLNDAIKLLAQKEQQINSDNSVFEQQNSEYADTINILDQAIALLNEIKDETSLIQKKEHIKEVSQNMHKSMKKLSAKRVFYQPLVNVLAQLSQNNYVDQENLKKVINFMNQLRQNLIDAQTTLQNQHESQSKLQQDILSETQAKVSGIQDVLIPLLGTEISTKQSEIRALSAILQDAQSNLSDAQENLVATQNRWIEKTATHNNLLQQYNNELLAIKDAENALKKGGIFRQ